MSVDDLRHEIVELSVAIKDLRKVIVAKDPDRSLTVEEAAEFLKVHPQQIRIETRIGSLPATRIGKRYTYTVADLVNFRERRKQNADRARLRQVK